MADYVTLGIDALCDRLCERRDTLIIYHVRSDADAIGSAFALREILTAMGMRAWCACADKIPDRLTFLTDGVQTSVRIGDVPFEYERVISVDSASPAQLGEMYESLGGRVDLMIDHHGLGTRYADGYVDGRAAATGEIIYKIAKKLISRGDLVEIDRRMASCMYAAISSDTGCFRFANTTPDTYRIAADLLELGADSEDINHRLYESKTVEQIRAEGEAANRLKLYCDGRVASVSFPYSSKTALGLKDENLETIIDIPRSIGGVEVAFSVRQPEDKGFFRVSMRSVGDFDVSRVCAEFGGGGHKKAAGCSLEANDIDSAVDAVLAVIIDEIKRR